MFVLFYTLHHAMHSRLGKMARGSASLRPNEFNVLLLSRRNQCA